jgi:hypothetical protein
MLDQCQANLEQWRKIDEEIKRQKEEGKEVDALSFLDRILETPERIIQEQTEIVDTEDKQVTGSALKEGNCKQDVVEENKIQETSLLHSENRTN